MVEKHRAIDEERKSLGSTWPAVTNRVDIVLTLMTFITFLT